MATTEFSTYFENAIIETMRSTNITAAAAYVALFLDAAVESELEAGTLTNEVSGNGYARQLVGLGVAADGASDNAAEIAFPQATGDWGVIEWVALMDAPI